MMMPKRSMIKKKAAPSTASSKSSKTPELADFIEKRDYAGAAALLDFQRQAGDESDDTLKWLAYASVHSGDFRKALEMYSTLEKESSDPPEELPLWKACCHFYLGEYTEAEAAAKEGPKCSLQNRILMHTAHKQNDESALMQYHQSLTNSTDDQLSLAAVHYLRGHYTEATDIYKRLVLEHRDDIALNVYVAMCYYKLDYYDVSMELLGVYLPQHPDSAIAVNLKACNSFRLYNGKAAAAELKILSDAGRNIEDDDLIQHNLVVFKQGANALQVLPPLLDFIPEARLNLVIYYLRNDEVQEAYKLLKSMEPSTPQEYILKGVVSASIGQSTGSNEHIKMAQQYFQLVGASASEADTIPGRQCMASCFFLLKQFDDVNIYMKSIKTYMASDDSFNWNHGIALAATKQYKEAEEALLQVQNESFRHEYTYLSWLARCHIQNGKPRLAWELYLKMDSSNESFNLLQLIANECYSTGAYFYSAKAFDVLERLDADPEYWEGKRGACVGVFQQVIAGDERTEALAEILNLLNSTTNPQVEYLTQVMKKWCNEKGIDIM